MTDAQRETVRMLTDEMGFVGVETEDDSVYGLDDGVLTVEGRDKFDGSRWAGLILTDGEMIWL